MARNNEIFRLLFLFIIFTFLPLKSAATFISVQSVYYDSIQPIKIDAIFVDKHYPKDKLKIFVTSLVAKRLGDGVSQKDIESVKYWGTINIKNLNKVSIFKIKYSYKLPCIWHYSAVLIIDNTNHNAYLFDLDNIELIKESSDSNAYRFAGRYKNRHLYGTFEIFEFKNNVMYQVFNSEEPVSNYSFDCESYENDDLKLQNVDLNNDSYLDLKFTGIKNFYCNGHEEYGRDERKPIKKEKITIIYYFNKEKLNWER